MSLLAELAPVLRYARGEQWPAGPAEQWTACDKCELRRQAGVVIARGPTLTLDFLGVKTYGNGAPVGGIAGSPDVIGHRGRDYLGSYQALPDDLRRDVVHGVEVDRAGRSFCCYALWHFNNVTPVGGNHEGDWEFVVVEHHDGAPVSVGMSQHKAGQRAEWATLEHVDGHPVVYVAKGSHALYAIGGHHRTSVSVDAADGRGDEATPGVEPLGRWARWPGRFGDTRGNPRRPWESTSPKSPGCQAPVARPDVWLDGLRTR